MCQEEGLDCRVKEWGSGKGPAKNVRKVDLHSGKGKLWFLRGVR